MSFRPMLRKEFKELVRSYKVIFVPLVLVILGLGQPLTVKMLPSIVSSATNLPPGTVIQIPTPSPGDVVAGLLGQLNQIGILMFILVTMGAVAAERVSGVASTILVKPVGRGVYLLSKAISLGFLAAVSAFLALAAAGYYTSLLIGPVNWKAIALGALLYLPVPMLAVAITLFFSSALPSPVAAGGAGLVAFTALNIVPKFMGASLRSLYPLALAEKAAAVIAAGTGAEPHLPDGTVRPILAVLVLTVSSLVAGWAALQRQEF